MSVNAPIRVCVLEGLYAQLLRANCPLSVAVELQTRGLCLDSAKWSMRYSYGGFSIAFFWPTKGQSYAATTTQSRRRRRRRKPMSRPETEGPNAIRREQPNKLAKRHPESVNRKLSLIDEHRSSQCTLVTPIRTTSSAVTEVDVPADVPGMEVDSAVPGTRLRTQSSRLILQALNSQVRMKLLTVTPWLRTTWINSALLNLPSLK